MKCGKQWDCPEHEDKGPLEQTPSGVGAGQRPGQGSKTFLKLLKLFSS